MHLRFCSVSDLCVFTVNVVYVCFYISVSQSVDILYIRIK